MLVQKFGCAGALSLVAVLTAGGAVAEIGSVSAVNRDMTGTPPARTSRDLTLGVQVFLNERVRTSDAGSGQIIFQDQTSLSIAPRTDMVLDRYVFDPDADTGDVAITLTKGALRFIGGRITKSRDAIVKTPTATIGIRGGMSIIQVAENGATSVIQIAGERTTVTGLTGKTVTLSRSSAKADVSSSGDAEYAGLADSEELAPVIQSFEGGGDGGSQAGTQESSIDSGTATVAEGNSEEPGGAERDPVSTQGEQQVEGGEREEEPSTTDPAIATAVQQQEEGEQRTEAAISGLGETTSTTGTDDTVDPNVLIPSAGGIITIPGGAQPFTTVASGSLIGTTQSGDVLRLPVPESSADFDQTLFGEPAIKFFAETLYPDTGFSEVNFDQGASLTGFTNVGAFGFSDLGIGFHAFVLGEGAVGTGQEAFVVFGTPTPGQAAEFPGDGGSFNPATNTATFYRIEPDLELGADETIDEGLFMLGNGSEPRFAPTGAARPATGGKLFNAQVNIEVDGASGEQFSNFSVLASPIETTGAGPLIAGKLFSTDVSGSSRLISTTNITLFEDLNGNTVFGPDGRYMLAISPLVAAAGGGFSFNTGEEHLLGQAGTSTGSFAPEPVSNVLTLDPGGQVVEANPLRLAQHPGSRALGASGRASARFDALHAAGIAVCSDGDCGQPISPGVNTGMYSARTGTFLLNGGSFAFENGLAGADTNEVLLSMGLEGNATEINTQAGGSTFEIIFNDSRNQSSAYLNDSLFALNSETTINAGGQNTAADVLVASSGLAGDGDIFVGQNPQNFPTQPVNARWGWWSASFDVVSAGTGDLREDLFHMGAWVAGVRPDPADIPASGVVAYGGVAIGTEANFSTLATRVVGGDFDLSYDFGAAQGNFRMNIAGLSINETAFGDPANSHAYQVNASTPVSFQADGTFFSGASSPVAATGGDFQIDDFGGNRQIVGVFVGDAR